MDTHLSPASPAAGAAPALLSRNRFAAVLALLLSLLLFKPALLAGDVEEYALMTIALSSHASPEIRASDIAQARQLMPGFGPALDILAQGIAAQAEVPQPGFYRGRDGLPYAIHFFGYSALAVVPFKLLQWSGAEPLKCFQIVNLTLVWLLGLSLFRLSGSAARALTGTALFMLCGGLLYWNWSSPEAMSAAALLAALVYFCSGAPLRGGLLAGIAALQNPTIVFVLGIAPALACCLHYRPQAGLLANLRATLTLRMLAGLALGLLLFALAPCFNLLKFGVPSVIAKVATASELISLLRLHSLYFDLNQGMIVAIPGVAGVLLLASWFGLTPRQRGQQAVALLLCIVLTAGFAVPALSVHNWNSGAAGVMRYAFWAAMPLLFLLLWRWQVQPRGTLAAVVLLLLVQGLAMGHASRYAHVQFSPLAQWVMRYAPALYNPESEIFGERANGAEAYLDPAKLYSYSVNGVARKTMYNTGNAQADALFCPPGQVLSSDTARVRTTQQWAYLNGPVRCIAAVSVPVAQFQSGAAVVLGQGWSQVEAGQGVWSDQAESTLALAYAQPDHYRHVRLLGHYFDGNRRTRVQLNGVDLGWLDLQAGATLAIPAGSASQSLTIVLRHEAPRSPGPQDGRLLAFYLQSVQLQ